jgi:hypothetical protein
MIGLAAGTRIWIVAGVTDMRRGFTGLSGMVQTAISFSFAALDLIVAQSVQTAEPARITR